MSHDRYEATSEGFGGDVSLDQQGLLDELVAGARLLNRPANLQVALRMGELVQRCLKQTEGAAGGARRGTRSYRSLAESVNLGRSPSVLWRCVKIHALSLQFPAIKTFVHLSTTHVRAIVNLPPEHQELLLTRAEAERWTAARLEKAAAELRYTARTEVDRGRASGFFEKQGADVIRTLSTSLSHLRRARGRTRPDLPAQVRHEIEQKLQELRQALQELSDECAGDCPIDESDAAPILAGSDSEVRVA